MKNVMSIGVVTAVVTGGMMAQGCGGQSGPIVVPDDPHVVAVYQGGTVTLEDLDRAVLEKAAEDRIPDSSDPEGWYRTLIEDIVLNRMLMQDEAINADLINEQLETFRTEEVHRLTVETFLAQQLPEGDSVTEADVRSAYEANRHLWVQQGRRQVHNIFLRSSRGDTAKRRAGRADEIRRQFDQGANFAELAEEYSDSESRHQGGAIGWLSPDQLAPAFAEVVFSLEEGQMSDPVGTPQGIHLFLVTGIIEPKSVTLEEASQRIRNNLNVERREALVVEFADNLPEVPETFVALGEDLADLIRNGESSAVVLRVGPYELNLGQLRQMVKKTIADGRPAAEELPERLLEFVARRERIFAEASRRGVSLEPEVEQRLEAAVKKVEMNLRRQQVIERALDDDPKPLADWFENNQRRFSTPLRLEVSRLVIPLERQTVDEVVVALEGLSQEESASETLEGVAELFGGRVAKDGWMTLEELGSIRPMAARIASTLKVGKVSPPYRTATTLEVLRIGDRQEPELQTLPAVYNRARSEFLRSHAAEVYGQWASSNLEEAALKFFPERVVASIGQFEGGGEPER